MFKVHNTNFIYLYKAYFKATHAGVTGALNYLSRKATVLVKERTGK